MKFQELADHLLAGRPIMYNGNRYRLHEGELWNETLSTFRNDLFSGIELAYDEFDSMAEFIMWLSKGKPFIKNGNVYQLVDGSVMCNSNALTYNWDSLNYKEFYKG